jgi:hypothetical protein
MSKRARLTPRGASAPISNSGVPQPAVGTAPVSATSSRVAEPNSGVPQPAVVTAPVLCEKLYPAGEVRFLVVDAGYSSLPPNKFNRFEKTLTDVDWESVRETVEESEIGIVLACGAPHGMESELEEMFPEYAVYETTNFWSTNYSLVDRKEWAVVWKSNMEQTPEMLTTVRKAQHLKLKHLDSGSIVTVLFTKHHVGTRGNGCQWDTDVKDTSWTSIWAALPQSGCWIVAGNLETVHPGRHETREFQIVSETPRDAIGLPSASALVGGMKASEVLECFGAYREGQFV